ncbi:hypothetical protein [uncultured Roseibium sp.]|uniref:hypothetical protein n=1 Tax=uncultured Roseibium sp. TaxID=1936171 RepID=UPI00262C5D5B|nr:hypothetical protein [uncultured Roseibium sp.]
MSDIRQTLKTFCWARAQHRLRLADYTSGFSSAVLLIAVETDVEARRVAAVLAGGFSSLDTQKRLAAWCGLKLAQKHGAPVLEADPDASFDRGPGGGVAPVTIDEAQRRINARLGVAA